MTTTDQQQRQFPCKQCGAMLQFHPGQASLVCPYCKAENAIAVSLEAIEEIDFFAALANRCEADATREALTVKCNTCSAESTLERDTVAGTCPFCGQPIVAEAASRRSIKPRSLLPFRITDQQAKDAFRQWISSRWFAPSGLSRFAERGGLRGVYIPYWTYDCNTISDYTGERGEDYTETETYTTVENGQTVTRTRTVTKTRWWPVSGRVYNSFDDLLIPASESLPPKYTRKLEPWDLENLVPYTDDYLAGFVAESYQLGLEQGFEQAKAVMDPVIRQTICRDIGGDHQRIHSVRTHYRDITFKHLLLPLWLSAYRYRENTYRFLVNARTGQVTGERPYSFWKIFFLVMTVLAAILTIVILANR